MATGTLNIKLAIANRGQFIKDIENRVSKAVSASLVEGLKQGWAKSSDAIQKTLAHEKLEIKFDEQAIQRDAVKLANQLRESAKFAVRADFTDAQMKFSSFTEEMSRYRKFSKELTEKEQIASLTRLETMRTENKRLSEGMREQARLLLTSTESSERKQAKDILSNLDNMERQATKSMGEMTKGFDDMGMGFEELEEDLTSTRSKAGKLYDAVKEKASGFWDSLHSSTANWIKGLVAAYISYSAIKTAVFDLIDYQDRLADAVKGTGVSAADSWSFMEEASHVLLDWGEATDLAGSVAEHGAAAFKTLKPLAGTFAKMQLLGADVSSMTEDFAAMANRYGDDVVPALEDFSQVMFNIENKTVRDNAMGNLLRQSQIMGTSGPKWLASASRGMVAVSKSLEGMGVRTGVITDFLGAVTEFNPFKENQDTWGTMFKTYLNPDEWEKMATGAEGGYEMMLTALGRKAETFKGYLSGDKMDFQKLAAMEGVGREQAEMMQAYRQGGDTFEKKFGQAMREKLDPKAMEKEYAKRQGTVERDVKELKHTWQTILMNLGKQFLPVIKEFSTSLKIFLTGPEFKQFTTDLAELTRVTIDTLGPYVKQIMSLVGTFLRMIDTVTFGKTVTTGPGGETTKGSLVSGAVKVAGAKMAYDMVRGGKKKKGMIRTGAKVVGTAGKALVGAGKFAAGARIPHLAGSAGKVGKYVDMATKARSVGALGKGATFLGGNAGTSAAAAAGPLAVVAAGAYAAYEINKAGQETKAAVAATEVTKEKLFTTREENFKRVMESIRSSERLTSEQKTAKIKNLMEDMHEEKTDYSLSWSGYVKGWKKMLKDRKKPEEAADVEGKTTTFGGKVGKFITGLFTSANEAMETVTKKSDKDLKVSVTEEAKKTYKQIHGVAGGSSMWDAVHAGIDEGIVDQLPTFQSAVFDSSSEMLTLVKETFGQIFATGQKELTRLKDGTASYSAGSETASGAASTTAAGGSAGAAGTVSGATAAGGGTGVTGAAPGITTAALSIPNRATDASSSERDVVSSSPTTAGAGVNIAGAKASVAPAAGSMPVAGANVDMTVAEGLGAPSLEERLLARAVTYLGGIFTNTTRQNGVLGNLNQNAAYGRLRDAVKGDLERLAGGAR